MSKKRFNLSRDHFAQERIGGIKEGIDELKAKHPEILSFVLFGSLSRGESRLDSDIDGYIFIDADYVEKLHEDDESPDGVVEPAYYMHDIQGFDTKTLSPYPHLRPDIDTFYENLLQNTLKSKVPGLSDEQVEHLRPLPMSERVIDTLIREWETAILEKNEFEKRAVAAHQQADSNVDIQDVMKTLHPQPKYYVMPSVIFRSMFHLDVGGGLKKYRDYLLQILLRKGQEGEYMWGHIVEDLERWEQKESRRNLPTEKRYPRTLSDAIAMYGTEKK